jgi:hypothetical protein
MRRADHSSRGVLPSVVCPVCVITKPCNGRPSPGIGRSATGKKGLPAVICYCMEEWPLQAVSKIQPSHLWNAARDADSHTLKTSIKFD